MKRTITQLLLLTISLGLFAQVPTRGLVASYPFNANANDESGNGNNGTVTGALLSTDRFNKPNRSYMFNGTTDYINIGHKGMLKQTDSVTISAWYCANSYKTNSSSRFMNLISDHSTNEQSVGSG